MTGRFRLTDDEISSLLEPGTAAIRGYSPREQDEEPEDGPTDPGAVSGPMADTSPPNEN